MEIRSRKFCFLALGVLLLALALPIQAKTIKVWLTGHSNEQLRIISDLTESQFTAKTGIAVEFTSLSWADNENRFLLAAASGDVPDVAGAGALFLPELGLRGALIDLTQMAGFDEVRSRANPSFYRSLSYKSLVFGVPYFSNVTTAYQRDDILQNLGLGEMITWDELIKALPKMQANGTNFMLQWGLGDGIYADLNMFMWQKGADDYNDDLTRSGYDSPEAIEAFKDYVDLYVKHKIAVELPPVQAFMSEDLAITLQYPSFYTNLIHSAPTIEGKWSIVQAPGYASSEKLNRTTFGTGSSLGIFERSKNKAEAWEFVKWFTDDSTQVELAKRTMDEIPGSIFIPANPEGALKIGIEQKAAEIFTKALAESTASVYGLVAPRHRRRYLQMAGQKAIFQGADPEEAMKEAAREHNVEIERKQKEYERFITRLLAEQKN